MPPKCPGPTTYSTAKNPRTQEEEEEDGDFVCDNGLEANSKPAVSSCYTGIWLREEIS